MEALSFVLGVLLGAGGPLVIIKLVQWKTGQKFVFGLEPWPVENEEDHS